MVGGVEAKAQIVSALVKILNLGIVWDLDFVLDNIASRE